MAAPSHPAVLPSGPGKALALVPGVGGQIQPIPVLQNTPQASVTMVRVVAHPITSIPLNGYGAASLGGAEGNGDFRGTGAVAVLGLRFRSKSFIILPPPPMCRPVFGFTCFFTFAAVFSASV